MICMFDEDFLNNLLRPPRNNQWPTHLTIRNYKIWFLRQSNYLLGFVFWNKYSFEITINKKWQENQSDPNKDEYESPTFVYCMEIDAMVPLVKVGVQIPLKIQGSWNDNNVETPKVVLESSKGIDGKLGHTSKVFHNITTYINGILEPWENIRKL